MTRVSFLAPVLALGAALAGPLASASAGLLPTSVTVTPEGDKFRWTYAVVLPTDSQLQTGNYFTIYDFGGFVAGSNTQPDGWSFSSELKGPIPPGVDPKDDPTLPNLHFVYTGPTTTVGQVGLGNFWALSDYDAPTDSFFTARTNRVSDGRIDTNITSTTVPVPTGPGDPGDPGDPVPTVAEPTTVALAALGLPLVGLGRWMRRRRRTCG
jgi:hypothetical protein